jgi:hypothetical protein
MRIIFFATIVYIYLFGIDFKHITDKKDYYDANRWKMMMLKKDKALLEKFIKGTASQKEIDDILQAKTLDIQEDIIYEIKDTNRTKK